MAKKVDVKSAENWVADWDARPGDLITKQEAARLLGREMSTLAHWARQKIGPKRYVPPIGRQTWYSLADIQGLVGPEPVVRSDDGEQSHEMV